jgi:hypothetical protein
MNDAQRAEFAANGYIVVPNCLSAAQLEELNAVYDAHMVDGKFAMGRDSREVTDRHGNTYTGHRLWSKAYRDLIDNPVMLPILREILGDPAWLHAAPSLPTELRPRIRLDHDNIHYRAPPAEGATSKLGNLHGGPSSWHVTAVYELKTVGPGDGGFGACPGSHTPEGRLRLDKMGVDNWKKEWTDSRWTKKHPGWDEDVPVHRVEGKAGDCILFTCVCLAPLVCWFVLLTKSWGFVAARR